jgi:hypothetical protein
MVNIKGNMVSRDFFLCNSYLPLDSAFERIELKSQFAFNVAQHETQFNVCSWSIVINECIAFVVGHAQLKQGSISIRFFTN